MASLIGCIIGTAFVAPIVDPALALIPNVPNSPYTNPCANQSQGQTQNPIVGTATSGIGQLGSDFTNLFKNGTGNIKGILNSPGLIMCAGAAILLLILIK